MSTSEKSVTRWPVANQIAGNAWRVVIDEPGPWLGTKPRRRRRVGYLLC